MKTNSERNFSSSSSSAHLVTRTGIAATALVAACIAASACLDVNDDAWGDDRGTGSATFGDDDDFPIGRCARVSQDDDEYSAGELERDGEGDEGPLDEFVTDPDDERDCEDRGGAPTVEVSTLDNGDEAGTANDDETVEESPARAR